MNWIWFPCHFIKKKKFFFFLRDKERTEKIVRNMKFQVNARDMCNSNPRVLLCTLCSQWLPLAGTVMDMVVSHLPSPLQLSEERVERLMCGAAHTLQSLPPAAQQLKHGEECGWVGGWWWLTGPPSMLLSDRSH